MKKLFGIYVQPAIIQLDAPKAGQNMICLKKGNGADDNCFNIKVTKDSLAAKLLLSSWIARGPANDYMFFLPVSKPFSISALYADAAAAEFYKKAMAYRKQLRSKALDFFFLDYYPCQNGCKSRFVFFPYKVESFLFFINEITEDNIPIDILYKFIYKILS